MKKHQFNVGKWLPTDFELIRSHIKGIKSYVTANPTALTPNIIALNEYVTNDPELNKISNDMFIEVPAKYQNLDYGPELKSWSEFIPLLNGIMTMTQTYNSTGCVGFPINALLDWAMGTEAGHSFFIDKQVNAHFFKVLNDWSDYLKSSFSKTSLLNSNEEVTNYPGHFSVPQYYWLSDEAMIGMANALNDGNDYTGKPVEARAEFIKAYNCPNIKDSYYGFTSWDDFFLRKFNSGIRPTASGDDVIVSACEAGPYRVAYNVKRSSKYWIKGQPYSLLDIFNEKEGKSPLTDKYEGGTIYQAFLSAMSYHRWNSPVDGKVKTVYGTDGESFIGTYYSEMLPSDPNNFDDAGPNESQGYISNVATRGIIEITPNNENIGDVVFIPIGMAEVGTCDITVKVGDTVNRGGEVGMFHFGGSTSLLIFQKDTPLLFDYHGQFPNINASNIPINSKLATVVKNTLSYPDSDDHSSLCIGDLSPSGPNTGAIHITVPDSNSVNPISIGNSQGEFLWGVEANGKINTAKGTAQESNPGASCNLNINFPKVGNSGYIIGENPNNDICAGLKIVVPSGGNNWPLIFSDKTTGKSLWAINNLGKYDTTDFNPGESGEAIINMPFPAIYHDNVTIATGLCIGDVSMTTDCSGAISIILPEGSESSNLYAIAIVDSKGALLWGVDGSGKEAIGD